VRTESFEIVKFETRNPVNSKSKTKIFEISPHPSPLPTGEREGVRGQNVRRKFSDFKC
jgi:hypothetical protein